MSSFQHLHKLQMCSILRMVKLEYLFYAFEPSGSTINIKATQNHKGDFFINSPIHNWCSFKEEHPSFV